VFFPIDKLGKYKIDKDTYNFVLNEKSREKSVILSITHSLPKTVSLSIELKNGYRSSVNFGNITKVVYIPKYRAVRLESHTKTHFSILKIYWREQFDLTSGWSEKMYSKTVWAKRKDY